MNLPSLFFFFLVEKKKSFMINEVFQTSTLQRWEIIGRNSHDRPEVVWEKVQMESAFEKGKMNYC